MLNLHRDKKIVRREPGRDEKILSDHRQDTVKMRSIGYKRARRGHEIKILHFPALQHLCFSQKFKASFRLLARENAAGFLPLPPSPPG